MFSELWKRSIIARGKTKNRSGKRRKPPRALLALERLESRELLSVATPDFIIASTPHATVAPGSGGQPLAPPPSSPPGYSPSQIENAYGFNQISFASYTGSPLPGAGQTIAIVDAYDDANAYSDLETFDAAYGLSNPTFTVVNQNGTVLSTNGARTGAASPSPDPSGGWEVEESLDFEWAHAIAPGANIVLVEADSASISDLMAAVSTASSYSGVSAVSMSWGGGEESFETSYDGYFTTPGVTFVAASGDNGAPPGYPAVSPNVLAVGGTTLTLSSSGDYGSETVWNNSYGSTGGGISAYERLPSYQVAAVTNNPNIPGGTPTKRTNPDVAYDADPTTGFGIYDSTPYQGGQPGWFEIGGTSAAAPQWAALVAIADQGRALNAEGNLTGATQTLPMLYQMPSSNFNDIISGNNNSNSAGPGYDLVTGLGTPIANNVINYLVTGSTSPLPPPTTPPAPTGLAAAAVSSSEIDLSWNTDSGAAGGYLIDSSSTGAAGSFTQIGSTTATTFRNTGLNSSTTYYYEVFAVNSAGDSPPSNVASATTLSSSSPPTTPPAPTGLKATAASSSEIDLSWNADAGATDGYLIDSSSTGAAGSFTQIGSTTSTTFSNTGLNPSTTYYYEVFAVNSVGDSSPSNVASATTLSPPPPPPPTTTPAPTGLTATAVSSDQINLSWNADSGATDGYDIDSSTTGAPGSFTQIVHINSTTISQIGLNPSTTYYYEVFAVDYLGDSPPSNVASATTLGTSPPPPTTPPAPTGLTATAVSSSQINLSWNADSGATDGYIIDSSSTGAAGSFTQIGSSTATTFSNTGLNPSTTYYYEVFAVNSVGDSPPSNVASATTSTPAAPTGLTATAVSSSQIDLSWNADSGATDGYDIDSSTTGVPGSFTQIAHINSTTISQIGLNPSTTYYYEVFAVNSAGDSPPSNVASATTLGTSPPPTTPPAPTGLAATAVSSNQINLSWNADSGADGYIIDSSSTGAAGSFTQIGSTTSTAFSNTGLNPSTTYYYEVFAFNSGGDSPPSNVASATTLGTTPPAPTGLTATAVSSNQINLSWNADSGATGGYLIDSSTTGAPGSFKQIGSITSTTISQIGLNPSTTYYYEVFAVNSGGDSPPSNVASATTLGTTPPAPTGLTATAVSSNQINLSWITDSGATDGYIIDRSSTGAAGSFTQIGTTTATTFSNSGLNPSTTYYYEIFAVNSGGDSPPSNVASATTLGTTPPAPTGLTATAVSPNQINLSWNTDSGATGGYLIDRSTTGAAGSFTQIGSTTATTFSNAGLNPSTAFYYEVFAVNSVGNSSPSNVASATTLSPPPPLPGAAPAPTGLTATAVSSSQINLSWNADSGATDGYDIDSSTTGAPGSFTQIVHVNSTTISQIGLNPSTTYYYEVFAVNYVGDSPPSNVAYATTLPSSPPSPSSVPLFDSGFKSPGLTPGPYGVDPTGTSWTFSRTAGIASSVNSMTVNNPPAPQDSEVGFLGAYASGFTQTVYLSTGSDYTISFNAREFNSFLSSHYVSSMITGLRPPPVSDPFAGVLDWE